MKNLANCNPKEFLVQTNKIRKCATEFLKTTGILNIRDIGDKIKGKEREEAEEIAKNTILENISNALDKMLETNVDKTVEFLCLCFFVNPKDYKKYKMIDFLNGITEMLNDKVVMSFFTSVISAMPKDTLNLLKK